MFEIVFVALLINTGSIAQNVIIPDTAFLVPLLNNPAINTNSDGFIQVTEANSYAGMLDLNNAGISDLTGIEAFLNITSLECAFNQISNVDLSSNTLLTYLSLGANQLINIDLSNNNLLTELVLDGNQLSSLNINNCPLLQYLYINGNQITNIDVSSNPNLINVAANLNQISNFNGNGCNNLLYLGLDDNLLSNIQINNCTLLLELFVNNNQLSNLDVSYHANLEWLECYNNQLSLLNTSNNNMLEVLYCNDNQLSSLNLDQMPNLIELDCSNNNLNYLNIQNGNNNNLATFNAINNPSLTCVQVDNVGNMNSQWPNAIDASASYNTFCTTCLVSIPDNNFKNLLLNNTAINTNGNSEIECAEASNYTGEMVINLQNIYDLTGIEAFTSLDSLYCSSNSIVSLDLSANTSLKLLWCGANDLINLEIGSNTMLEELRCNNNDLTSLDVSGCTNLKRLFCYNNEITTLDLSGNSQLEMIDCKSNLIGQLNLQNGNNTLISYLEASDNLPLTCVQVDDVNYFNTNFSGSIDVGVSYSTSCSACVVYIPDTNFKNALISNSLVNTNADNEIQCNEAIAYTGALNVSNLNIADITGIEAFVNLTALDCSYNQLTYFYLNIPTLTTLNCSHNNLYNHMVYCSSDFNLDISYNFFTSVSYSELATFNCSNNTITSIDVTACPNLTALNCANNLITTANLSYNANLNQINCSNNLLNSLNVQNGNNSNLNYFNALNNPNLNCIQVDNSNFMNNNWFAGKDPIASYSNNCSSNLCQPIPIAFSAPNSNLSATPMVATFNNATPNLTNYQFVWYFGDGTFIQSNAPTINHTYTFNGVYSVALLAIDVASGCSDTLYFPNYITCNASGALGCNHTVNINPSGVVNACAGSPVPLSATTNLSSYNAQWYRNGVMLGGASQDQYIASLSGNYSLTISDIHGCPVTSSLVQINYNLPSNNPPIISANGLAGNCGNVNVNLTASGSFTNYLWSNGQTGNNITVTQGGTYTVTGQSPACDAVSVPYEVSGSNLPVPPVCMITVDENDNKNIVIWEKPISMEINSFLILREDSNTPNIYTEIDELDYAELSEYKDLNVDANERAYRYKIAVKDTCGGITISSAAQRSMHLNVTQGNNILARQLNWNVYQGQPQTFDYYLIYRETAPGNLNLQLIDSVASSQTWYNDNSLSNLNDTLRAYMIGYRITSPCVSTRAVNQLCQSNVTSAEFVEVDGINNISQNDFDFNIYPNPNNGKFIVEIPYDNFAHLKVYNLLGELNYAQQLANHQTSIDLSSLNCGVYLVNISNDARISTKRLIISK